MKTLWTAALLIGHLLSFSQDPLISSFMDELSMETLTKNLREFSGEDSTIVNGSSVLILNRENGSGNDLAAEYIKERFESYGLSVVDQVYSAGGRNIYAVQSGVSNPDSIYIICGHYDSRANYCADDNASAITAILETARIFSGHCFANTIIYAAWDEEEIGLKGSKHFANLAEANGDRILGVLNIDMMAYDGDNDTDYDIDLNSFPSSEAIRDLLLGVTEDYDLNLIPNIVQPGTSASDHSSFWNRGYGAVLLGEAWSNGDVTPGYHTSNDRIQLLNLPYFHEMAKLALGYVATAAEPMDFDASFTINDNVLTANYEFAAEYQWYSCNGSLAPIPGAESSSYTATESGSYAVELIFDECSVTGECMDFSIVTSSGSEAWSEIRIHPNPTTGQVFINLGKQLNHAEIQLISLNGASAYRMTTYEPEFTIDINAYARGLYFLEIISEGSASIHKLVKN